MHPFPRFLQQVSNSKRGIALGCVVLLLTGIVMAVVTAPLVWMHRPLTESPVGVLETIDAFFADLDSFVFHEEVFPEVVNVSGFPLHLPASPQAWETALQTLSQEDPPPIGAAYAWGCWNRLRGRYPEVIAAFHRENQYYPHPLARFAERDAALRAGDFAHIDSLLADPRHADEMKGVYLFRVGMRQNNWKRILEHFWGAQYGGMRPEWLMLSLLAGGIWIVLIAGLREQGVTASFVPWMLLALGLGWISTWPTIGSLIWMDRSFDLRPGDDFFSGLLYFTVSVGLREEVCKLLLFAPLLPLVLSRDRENDALVLGALVGLGFAIEENLGYFVREQSGGVAVSRFVSANLLHLTFTGINALALTRAVRDPHRWLGEGVLVLATTVGLHGLYNALLTAPVPGWGDMSYFSGTILVGCTLLFFRELPGLSRASRLPLSHTSLFVWGLCLLFNLELLLTLWMIPSMAALVLMGQSIISASLSAYIYIYVVREPLFD